MRLFILAGEKILNGGNNMSRQEVVSEYLRLGIALQHETDPYKRLEIENKRDNLKEYYYSEFKETK